MRSSYGEPPLLSRFQASMHCIVQSAFNHDPPSKLQAPHGSPDFFAGKTWLSRLPSDSILQATAKTRLHYQMWFSLPAPTCNVNYSRACRTQNKEEKATGELVQQSSCWLSFQYPCLLKSALRWRLQSSNGWDTSASYPVFALCSLQTALTNDKQICIHSSPMTNTSACASSIWSKSSSVSARLGPLELVQSLNTSLPLQESLGGSLKAGHGRA